MTSEYTKLEDVVLTTENCRYCLMCRHIAPLEQVTYREEHSPHGMALLVASERRGMIEWNDLQHKHSVHRHRRWETPRAHCVTDQPLHAALAAVRADLAAQNIAPSVVYAINRQLKQFGNPYAEESPEAAEGTGDVALFVGDEATHLWPDALDAALSLLKAVGIEPVLIGKGRNSGFIASSMGFPDTATTLAQANLDELAATGATRLLVLSPGDHFAFNQLYPERLDLSLPEGVEVIEVSTLMASELRGGSLSLNGAADSGTYAYVDPTHAVRVADRHDDPRELLAAVMSGESKELFWRRDRAHPAGTTYLQFTQPAVADKLTHARLADAQKVGAETIVTEDPATLYQLNRFAADYDLRIVGLYETLVEHLS